MKVAVSGEEFILKPERVLYWRSRRILLVADLHLGKIAHFRRSGIPVPTKVNEDNLSSLVDLINLTKPERLICLGDLFHSHYNTAWEEFGELVNHFSAVAFELVIGNHDIMSTLQYERKRIRVYDQLRIGNFLLTHHPLECIGEDDYNLAGHIHPGVQMLGKGRQALTLPCFYFGKRQGILPAFGGFTGIARIKPQKDDHVYVIAEDKIIKV
ncbi:MAG TPA: ligase-associated DNA damage response endonuclease PdeM [Cyclobacteriaceae bacterium]|nr:ligase-associated DNA damage response endonuclease PdeM [Cyclobacteriaceae bacterium]